MINRNEFETYLCNKHNCTRFKQGIDVALRHDGHTASLGNHNNRAVKKGQARRFLQDLGFEGAEYDDICDEWNLK